MSDTTAKAGPALEEAVREVQGSFPNDATMQDALAQLELAGIDRADLSLPNDRAGSSGTPNDGAANPVDAVDKAQLRTMGTSMAGFAGAAAVAGATIATGGAAAVAAVAALAVGAGTALTANAAGNAADKAQVEDRNEKAAAGTLILAVRTPSDQKAEEVTGILTKAGATAVKAITRGADAMTAGIGSASWTGA